MCSIPLRWSFPDTFWTQIPTRLDRCAKFFWFFFFATTVGFFVCAQSLSCQIVNFQNGRSNLFGTIKVADGCGCVHLGVALFQLLDTDKNHKNTHTFGRKQKEKQQQHLKLVKFFRRPCKKKSKSKTPWITPIHRAGNKTKRNRQHHHHHHAERREQWRN